MESNKNMKALFIVANAGFSDEIMEIARETGIKGATILNARGESFVHESILGITINPEKEMILCITDEATAEKTMSAIKEKAGVRMPAHSVCFTMPVDKTVGLTRINPAE